MPYRFVVKTLLRRDLDLNLKGQFCLTDAAEVGNLDTWQHCTLVLFPLLWKYIFLRAEEYSKVLDNSSQQVPTYLFSLFSNVNVCISVSIVCDF